MAKNDYFVMAYKLLQYLYECLKSEKKPDTEKIKFNTKHFPVGEDYFNYLIETLAEDGYIRNVAVFRADNSVIVHLDEDIQITPKGIEYIRENSLMNKIAAGIKDFGGLLL